MDRATAYRTFGAIIIVALAPKVHNLIALGVAQ